jgi:hypothetical protein
MQYILNKFWLVFNKFFKRIEDLQKKIIITKKLLIIQTEIKLQFNNEKRSHSLRVLISKKFFISLIKPYKEIKILCKATNFNYYNFRADKIFFLDK